jgi:alpha-ribazole phosphatase
MILHLIRHPPPRVAPGICYGRLDVAAENVPEAAAVLRAVLPSGLPVWTSPLVRCRMLADALHDSPVVDERLAEMDFGDWEGRAWDAIARAELDAWAADIAGYVPPGGESPLAVQRRALAFVAGLDVSEAVLVTHAGVMRTLVAHVRKLPPERWLDLKFGFGERTVLTFSR